jgi:hypothetical protein
MMGKTNKINHAALLRIPGLQTPTLVPFGFYHPCFIIREEGLVWFGFCVTPTDTEAK